TMAEGPEGTTVTVVTDLAITGKPAQFGRGMIQDVSDKLLAQFVECLRTTSLAAGGGATGEGEVGDAAAASSAATPAGQDDSPPTGSEGPAGSGPTPAGGAARPADDSLDLGAAVLPVLLKSYGKQ